MVVGGKGGEGEGMGIYVGADFAGWLWVSHTQNADIIFIKKRYIRYVLTIPCPIFI